MISSTAGRIPSCANAPGPYIEPIAAATAAASGVALHLRDPALLICFILLPASRAAAPSERFDNMPAAWGAVYQGCAAWTRNPITRHFGSLRHARRAVPFLPCHAPAEGPRGSARLPRSVSAA